MGLNVKKTRHGEFGNNKGADQPVRPGQSDLRLGHLLLGKYHYLELL